MTSRAIKPTARKTELRLPSFVSTYALCYARTVIAIERGFNHFLIALHYFFQPLVLELSEWLDSLDRSYVDLQRRSFRDPTWFLVKRTDQCFVSFSYTFRFFLRFEFSRYISMLCSSLILASSSDAYE